MKKVISTCLFGSSPISYKKYAQFAPISARFCQEHLPDWKFRLYHDNTVNKNIINTLRAIDNVELIEMPTSKGREGCFWRFLAFDDCDIAVCRDLDWKMQNNDLFIIKHFESINSIVHFSWVCHNRKGTKTKRYYMAGCVGSKKLPFSTKNLINSYKDDKSIYCADEWFLTNYFVPEILKYQSKIPIYVEPQPRRVPKGKTKECIELFPDIEDYIYLEKNYEGI
jgi:hypothetical protein